jgi:NAD(P)-dependent dehydrogenase (short-subunit alcohol dehydrogenase family)
MKLQDAVAVITGASRGIGRATALAFAREGAHVVCAARSTEAAPSKVPGTIDETVREIQAMGRRALAVPCNLLKDEDTEALARRTLDEFGRVDILINNAGTMYRVPLAEMSMKQWDVVLNVNLRGTVLCTKLFLPQMMEERRGCIINVSSGAASVPLAELAELNLHNLAYSVSKLAVDHFTEGLALELRPHNINVTCLRVDVNIAAEGAVYYNPDIDYSQAEKPEAGAETILWLATHDSDYNGRVVSITEIRQARLAG